MPFRPHCLSLSDRMIPPMPALLPTGRSQQPAEGRWEYVGYRNQQQVDPFHYYQSEQVHLSMRFINTGQLTNSSLGQSSQRSAATNGPGEIPS